MDLFTEITTAYPELTDADFVPTNECILLCDDGDGVQYIAKWEHALPLPDGMKVGK